MTSTEDRGAEALQFIRVYIHAHGYPPSVREITAAIGLQSTSDGHRVLKHLVNSGAIEITPGTSRGIRIVRGITKTEAM